MGNMNQSRPKKLWNPARGALWSLPFLAVKQVPKLDLTMLVRTHYFCNWSYSLIHLIPWFCPLASLPFLATVNCGVYLSWEWLSFHSLLLDGASLEIHVLFYGFTHLSGQACGVWATQFPQKLWLYTDLLLSSFLCQKSWPNFFFLKI